MKRTILTILTIVVVLTSAMVGPDLWDAYRLQQYISKSTQDYEANGGPWPHLSDACAACHGPNGNSVNQFYPALAAQKKDYLIEQLRSFASGQRINPMMNAMARNLKASDFDGLATYFAQQTPQENPYFEADANLKERGKKIVGSGGCAGCHGADLMGRDKFPRLAGQGYGYLLKQLDGFAGNSRRDPSNAMNAFAAAWSPDDRKAIATFLASHPIKGSEKP